MTIRTRFLIASLAILFSTQSSQAQVHFNAAERRIITLTDERRNADSLLQYLASPETRVAWRAAIGLANIGDTAVRPALIEHYATEVRDSVADAEAFALGMLGPNQSACEVILRGIIDHPSAIRLTALARTAPDNFTNTVVKVSAMLVEQKKLQDRDHADALLRLALRKITSQRMMDDAELLSSAADPEARWRAACIFARVGDSLNISHRLDILKDLLIDQGTPYARMFAATALGRAHNPSTDTLLTRAYRGEEDWRVRINILNALAKSPTLDSSIFDILQTATSAATVDDPKSIHVGVTAQQTLGSFIAAGHLTHADSAKLRDYLDAFNGTDGRNEGIAPIVAATATISAARLQTPTLKTALDNYFQSTDPYVREIAVRAAGMTSDTVNFYNLLASMPAVTALEEVPRLEALDSMWRRATRGPNPDTAFRAALERTHAANVYRTMLMRVSDVVYDPAVATLALAHLQDSTIVVDTFRTQAQDYVRKYLRAFADRQFRDELLAAVSAEAWFRDPSAEVPALLRTDYDSARQWHDVELMDSIKSALQAIGENTTRLKSPLPIISNIDWTYLESLPDKMLFGLERGAIQLRLHTFETPLTVL
ncbi:MAG: hypothetical protein Q8922_15530, partial [Bacteroidota bacterium]|nr:hypothetical protein [Bacteroidota bacterium]